MTDTKTETSSEAPVANATRFNKTGTVGLAIDIIDVEVAFSVQFAYNSDSFKITKISQVDDENEAIHNDCPAWLLQVFEQSTDISEAIAGEIRTLEEK